MKNKELIIIGVAVLVLAALLLIPAEKWKQWFGKKNDEQVAGTTSTAKPTASVNSSSNVVQTIPNYFKISEFDDKSAPGSGENMNEDFVRKLNLARHYAGVPFVVLVGYHVEPQQDFFMTRNNVSGDPYTTGLAVRVKYSNNGQLQKIYKGLNSAGFRNINTGNGFVHVDTINI